jgi:hypothetical protein
MGLCYKCGAKWSRDHKCSPDVLHAMQDLWEGHSDDEEEVLDTPPSDSVCLAISKAAMSGKSSPKTI